MCMLAGILTQPFFIKVLIFSRILKLICHFFLIALSFSLASALLFLSRNILSHQPQKVFFFRIRASMMIKQLIILNLRHQTRTGDLIFDVKRITCFCFCFAPFWPPKHTKGFTTSSQKHLDTVRSVHERLIRSKVV